MAGRPFVGGLFRIPKNNRPNKMTRNTSLRARARPTDATVERTRERARQHKPVPSSPTRYALRLLVSRPYSGVQAARSPRPASVREKSSVRACARRSRADDDTFGAVLFRPFSGHDDEKNSADPAASVGIGSWSSGVSSASKMDPPYRVRRRKIRRHVRMPRRSRSFVRDRRLVTLYIPHVPSTDSVVVCRQWELFRRVFLRKRSEFFRTTYVEKYGRARLRDRAAVANVVVLCRSIGWVVGRGAGRVARFTTTTANVNGTRPIAHNLLVQRPPNI